MKIEQATFVVTGGASGLGAACVAHLAERGANVVVADVAAPQQTLLDRLGERVEQVLFAQADITSESELQEAVTQGEQQFGGIRGLIACAGILHAERLLPREGLASLEAFQRVINVNLTGTFNALRIVAAAIAKTEPSEEEERGVLITTSSVAAFDGQIGQASYAASKGAIASLTLPLARELAGRAIRVVSIAPGVFETPMMNAAPDKVRESLIAQTPFPQRFGKPAEFAQFAAHIIENQMLNGCVLRLDGAIRMGAK